MGVVGAVGVAGMLVSTFAVKEAMAAVVRPISGPVTFAGDCSTPVDVARNVEFVIVFPLM